MTISLLDFSCGFGAVAISTLLLSWAIFLALIILSSASSSKAAEGASNLQLNPFLAAGAASVTAILGQRVEIIVHEGLDVYLVPAPDALEVFGATVASGTD